MKKITIYIANLTHVRDERPSTEAIPLNIGYLAAYIIKYMNNVVIMELFNLPSELELAFKKKVPDILLTSNYIWNFNLNYFYLSHYKSRYPELITVMGGPNYPGIKEEQESFLKKYDKIDFYVYLEGENSLLSLIKRVHDVRLDIMEAKKKLIKGCHYLMKMRFINGGAGERIKKLDDIPSPYLTGLFDKMLKNGFVPILQTNRGCPFTCVYCCSGKEYYSKVYKYSMKRIVDEIDYISKIVKAKSLHIADDNYGLFNQDILISSKLNECIKNHGWPLKINLSTSKINKNKVFKCISQLGDAALFSASMQSLNKKTLDLIKRKNLTFNHYEEIIDKLQKKDVRSLCELILCLPEETKESHLMSIKKALQVDIKDIGVYTCMLLKNTSLLEDEYYEQFQMNIKYRVLPRDFGIYKGKKILEIEKVCVATRSLSLNDYLYLRGFNILVSAYYNLGVFVEIMSYLKFIGVSLFDLLLRIYEQIKAQNNSSSDFSSDFYQSLMFDVKAELWENEKDIYDFFNHNDNFKKLIEGQLGANLVQKYQSIMIENLKQFSNIFSHLILSKNFYKVERTVIFDLFNFSLAVRADLFKEFESIKIRDFSYDIPNWIGKGMQEDINKYKKHTSLIFFHDDKQKAILKDYLDFYGSSMDSKGKIITRINLTTLYRKIKYN